MKEYTVTLTLRLEAEESDYEQVEIFSQKLSEEIIESSNHKDIEIVESEVVNIDDFNDYDIDMGNDFEDY